MGLDQPWYARFWDWLTGVAGCFTLSCDFGTTRNGESVNALLMHAIPSTLRLVTLATVLAIFIGIAVGIITAIRQYSGFDYVVTFLAFLFFSLPVFWAAVLLKEFGAIRFNDWIVEPTFSWLQIAVISLVLAFTLQSVLGGSKKRRLYTFGAALLFIAATMTYMSMVEWFRRPAMGIVMVALAGIGGAVLLVGIFAGFGNRKVLNASLVTVGLGLVSYYAVIPVLEEPSFLKLFLLFVLAIGISLAVGALMGGYSKKTTMTLSAVTGALMAVLIVVDRLVNSWMSFLKLKPRPISTIGSQTPNFAGDFWQTMLDWGTQLILPTLLLTLISVASYSRYTRSTMLETLNQDYVRTARSKGLSERVVIVKHAFRNALIPITTIVALDFAALIGGAVITEKVFGWQGMGAMFANGLHEVDPAPVMAFFVVTGTAAIIMNFVADIIYASLDPRIRR